MSRLPRPVRQLVASGVATAADAAGFLALCWIAGLTPGAAAVVGNLIGGLVNFGLARAWVFAARDRAWLAQAARYAVVVVGGGAAVSGAVVAALATAGVALVIAKAAAVVVVLVAWTYPMAALVAFAPARASATAR